MQEAINENQKKTSNRNGRTLTNHKRTGQTSQTRTTEQTATTQNIERKTNTYKGTTKTMKHLRETIERALTENELKALTIAEQIK